VAKKVTLTLSDNAHEIVAQAADKRPVGNFLRDVLENYAAGTTGDAAGVSLDARVGKIVDEKLGSAVSESLKDQTLVELETAELIAERAIKWAKIAGVFLAVPAALFVALFSFLGVKTYFDLRDVAGKIADAEKTIELAQELSDQSQATSKDLIEKTNQLRVSVTEAEAIVERLRKVEEGQRGLEERFKTIEGRVTPGVGRPGSREALPGLSRLAG
jgi:hypothetical protein